MKTKTVPFDLETAKKIQVGEVDGKIKTRGGREIDELFFFSNIPQSQYCVYASIDRYVHSYCCDGSERGWDRGGHWQGDLVLEVPDNEPQLKVFDKVRVRPDDSHSYFVRQYDNFIGRIVDIDHDCFVVVVMGAFQDRFTANELELVEETENHEFKPFDKVLVRDDDSGEWCLALYAYRVRKTGFYRMVGGASWEQCIPYEGNEHLLGTTEKQEEE